MLVAPAAFINCLRLVITIRYRTLLFGGEAISYLKSLKCTIEAGGIICAKEPANIEL
jgi:hypothetical protein